MTAEDGTANGGAELSGTTVLVLGWGIAGRSAFKALKEIGANAVVVDRRFDGGGGDTREGSPDSHEAPSVGHASIGEVNLKAIDAVMASAAFAPHSAEILACLDAGLPVWSEMEFAWRVRTQDVPWVLVTGTNGKTTTTQMVGAMASAAGIDVKVCGNMGEPVIDAARAGHGLLAVEIASLQLHFTETVSPIASVCLNVDVDHLDWHGSIEQYRADKARVYRNVQIACVYPAADRMIEDMVADAEVVDGCRAVGVTLGIPAISQLGIVDGVMCDRAFHDQRRAEALELASLDDLAHLVAGDVPPYLAFNALCAAALARAAGAPPAAVRDALRGFSLDEHRTAHVRSLDGVAYVDDSKATNAHAALAAFGGRSEQSVVWICGGEAKGQEFGSLVSAIAGRLRAAVVIGEDQELLCKALSEHAANVPLTRIEPGETVMARAVSAAREHALPGDTVLLSPACASFDQFTGYAHRGDAFAAEVLAL